MTQMTAAVYGRQSRGKEKSIEEQVELGTADAVDQGWAVTATYRDRTSASRYRKHDREEWANVLAAIESREFDALVLWVSSRGDRDLTTWSGLLDACRKQGVLIRVTDDDRTYDVRRGADWQTLAQQGVSNAVDSDKISTNVRRGHAGSARAGRPSHGRCPYGYARKYDPNTGDLLGQEPDPASAPVVVEIFTRIAKYEPVSTITADLQSRDVPRPEAGKWHRQRVRDIAQNPAYIGVRVLNGTETPGTWPPLVDEVTYYAARRVLSIRALITTRPGRQKHLLSYLATCSECGGQLCAVRGKYRCLDKSCVTIDQEATDLTVESAVVLRLRSPKIYAALRQAGAADDREAVAAEKELGKLTDTLEGWRRSAAKNQTTPESLAVIEADLTQQIKTVRARLERVSVPPALREVLEPGEDVAVRWGRLTLVAKRAVIRRLVDDLNVGPATRPGSQTFEPARLDGSRWRGDRVSWGELV